MSQMMFAARGGIGFKAHMTRSQLHMLAECSFLASECQSLIAGPSVGFASAPGSATVIPLFQRWCFTLPPSFFFFYSSAAHRFHGQLKLSDSETLAWMTPSPSMKAALLIYSSRSLSTAIERLVETDWAEIFDPWSSFPNEKICNLWPSITLPQLADQVKYVFSMKEKVPNFYLRTRFRFYIQQHNYYNLSHESWHTST